MTTFHRIAALLACLLFVSGPSFGQGVVASVEAQHPIVIDAYAPGQDTYGQPADIIQATYESDGITEQKDDSRSGLWFRLNGTHDVIPKAPHTFTAPPSIAVSFIPRLQYTGFCSGLAPPARA